MTYSYSDLYLEHTVEVGFVDIYDRTDPPLGLMVATTDFALAMNSPDVRKLMDSINALKTQTDKWWSTWQ